MRYLKYVLHVVVILGVVVAGVRYIDSDVVLNSLANFTLGYALLVALLPAIQLAIKSWRFVVFMRPLAEVGEGVTFRAYAAGQPATLIPGGIAARIGLMRQVGVPVGTSSAAVLFSSVFDQAVFVMGLVVAVLLFPDIRGTALIVLGVIGGVALLLLLRPVRRLFARGARWGVARLGFAEGWDRFVEGVQRELGPRTVVVALALSVAAFVGDLLLLDLCLRGVGVSIPYPQLFLAYLLPTMLGRLSALPAGGIGVAEAGMVGYLVAGSGLTAGVAAAAVAVFRLAAIFLQAFYGALVYLLYWRGEEESGVSAVSQGEGS